MTTPREIYLDHAASAPLRPAAREAMLRAFAAGPGNAGSAHAAGRRLRRLLENAREAVAELVAARPAQVVFTSGTTESNRLGVRGLLRASPARHLVVTDASHDGLRALAAALAAEGVAVEGVTVGAAGHVRCADVVAAAGDDPVVVALPVAESVTGALQPVGAVTRALPRAHVHADAAQAVGRSALSFAALGAATMSFSAHKIGGPQGIGALLVRDDAVWSAPDGAATQERGRRAGTEAVALACGFAAAASVAASALATLAAPCGDLLDPLRAFVAQTTGAETVTRKPAAPGILLIRFAGCPGDALAAALDATGIRVSTGTACASGARLPPHVLTAGGRSPREPAECVRVSAGWTSSPDDVARLVAALRAIVPRARSARAPSPTAGEKKFT